MSLTKDDGNYRCLCREGTYGKNCEFSEYTTTHRTTTENGTTLSVAVTEASENVTESSAKPVSNPAENETN